MTYTEDDLTPWFPPDVKPARIGLYQRDWKNEIATATPDYFDGTNWFATNAFRCASLTPLAIKLPWRGLNKQP